MAINSELSVSIKIQVHPLVEVIDVRHSIAAAFDDLELIVETLNETTGVTIEKIISDFFEMRVERADETIKTAELAMGDTLDPTAQFALALPFLTGDFHKSR
nr:hypothetical protein [Thiorhodococcus mannitoliphagus]